MLTGAFSQRFNIHIHLIIFIILLTIFLHLSLSSGGGSHCVRLSEPHEWRDEGVICSPEMILCCLLFQGEVYIPLSRNEVSIGCHCIINRFYCLSSKAKVSSASECKASFLIRNFIFDILAHQGHRKIGLISGSSRIYYS